MSRRGGDWHLVGQPSDPVPASEWGVGRIASGMRSRAAHAATLRNVLHRLSSLEGWRGEAAESFAEQAANLVEDLGRVEERYERVADALDVWAEDLAVARSDTWRALVKADESDRLMRLYAAELAVEAAPTPEQLDHRQLIQARHDEAGRSLDDARALLDSALADLDEGAERTKRRIDEAADLWDDGAWGDLKGVLRHGAEMVEILCKALEIIATILGAIILVLVLTVGAPVALLVAAAGLAILLLAGHAFLMAVDDGDVTWQTIGLDIVNVALSVTGLKGVTSALTGLRALAPQAATRLGNASRYAAIERLAAGNLTQFQNATRIADPTNNLARWAASIREGGDLAGATAAGRALDSLAVQPSRLSVLLHQDREVAQLHILVDSFRQLDLNAFEVHQVAQAQGQIWQAVASSTALNGIAAYQLPSFDDNVADVGTYVREHAPWLLHPTH